MAALVLGAVVFVEFILPGREKPRPNLLLIVLDTVRADRVSAVAATERRTTPFLEELAAQGTVFLHARSPANWTLPAHASLFTGLAPSEHGCHFEHRWLADEAFTLAEAMQKHDYATAGFSCNVNVSRLFHLEQGFDHFWESFADPEVASDGRSASDVACERLLGWIKRRGKQPSFVFLNLMDAHLPYDAAPGFETCFGTRGAALPRERLAGDLYDSVIAGQFTIDREFATALAERYDNALRGLDERLKRLFAELRQSGFLDHCAVVVTSDHGENLGEHGLVDHQGSLHETVLRVPLILQGQGVDSGRRIQRPVSTACVFAWVQDLAHGAFQFPDDARRDPVLSERMRPIAVLERWRARHADTPPGPWAKREAALVLPDLPFKLIRREGEEDRLYGLPAVAGQEIGQPLNVDAATVARLGVTLDEVRARARPLREVPRRDLGVERGDAALAELSRLGYLGGSRADSAPSIHAVEHFQRGVRAHEAGDLAAARVDWQAAAAIEPRFGDALFNLAVVTEKLEPGAARGAWEAYLRIAFDDPTQAPQAIETAQQRAAALK